MWVADPAVLEKDEDLSEEWYAEECEDHSEEEGIEELVEEEGGEWGKGGYHTSELQRKGLYRILLGVN